ncbi:hypothetical protein Tco_0938537 [Tanacetum coccineum]|uniref:Reverse transcriptase domain-containing protein n=1 Tax=Tanacetum coccineum TaxID=301880 RepID=A0ABQ5DK02_9ASTR
MQAAQDRQKSYADRKRKPMEFEIGDRVMLKAGTSSRVEQSSPYFPCVKSEEIKAGYHWLRFAGTQGGALNSPGNVKILSNKNTHNSSQTGLRHPLQGLSTLPVGTRLSLPGLTMIITLPVGTTTLPVGTTTLLMTTSLANNSVFSGFFKKQKLAGPNFIDWYRQLRIVLSIKDKLNYLEQPLPPTPVAPAGQQVAPEILGAHTA